MGGPCNMYDERRGAYGVLVVKPGGIRPLGRLRRRWQNIKLDLQEVGCDTHTHTR